MGTTLLRDRAHRLRQWLVSSGSSRYTPQLILLDLLARGTVESSRSTRVKELLDYLKDR